MSDVERLDPTEYDYVVVGAGSAGCAIAGRLSARPDIRVLLIEAGPRDDHPLIHIPRGFPYLTRNPRYAWNFMTEPQPHRNFGPEMWPRGKMLGGSSSINGMIYSRGHPQDYESWAAAGNSGWGWSEVLPCFKAMEDHSLGASETRGAGGPMHVTAGRARSDLSEHLIEAGVQMGLPRAEDLNTPSLEGIGYCASNTYGGRRFSAARAYLKRRPNLKVATETEVDQIVFRDGRATGVRARGPSGRVTYQARGEVIVSAGALLSPKLLQLSGIGDGPMLRSMGIDVRHANSHVGAHMLDHIGVAMPHRMTGARGLNPELRGLGLARSIMRYLLFRDGVLSTAGEVGAFVRLDSQSTRPDAQLALLSLSLQPTRPGRFMGDVERSPGFQVMAYVLHGTSEGTVTLASPDASAHPRLQPNSLSTEYDRQSVVALVKLIRRLVGQQALVSLGGEESEPWRDAHSDDEILALALLRARNCNHAVGTCRMGPEGEGVVDERLRVRGVAGLRVADCSVMPSLPSGNTNGPAQMVGWRAAELILEDRDRPALSA